MIHLPLLLLMHFFTQATSGALPVVAAKYFAGPSTITTAEIGGYMATDKGKTLYSYKVECYQEKQQHLTEFTFFLDDQNDLTWSGSVFASQEKVVLYLGLLDPNELSENESLFDLSEPITEDNNRLKFSVWMMEIRNLQKYCDQEESEQELAPKQWPKQLASIINKLFGRKYKKIIKNN